MHVHTATRFSGWRLRCCGVRLPGDVSSFRDERFLHRVRPAALSASELGGHRPPSQTSQYPWAAWSGSHFTAWLDLESRFREPSSFETRRRPRNVLGERCDHVATFRVESRMQQPPHSNPLQQSDAREAFRANGMGHWTVLYGQVAAGDRHTGLFSAVAAVSHRADALSTESWDLSIGTGGPSLFQRGVGDDAVVEYSRWGLHDDVEPLVLHRSFHGVRPQYNEVVEDFRLMFNLCDDRAGHLLVVEDDGSESIVAEVSPTRVRVLTQYLHRYQAAKQVDLLLFIDSTEYGPATLEIADADVEEQEEFLRASFYVRRIHGRPFSRYFGKRIVPAPPVSESCVWPYEVRDDHFPDFIIGVDDHGKPVRHTCNGDLLSNYFGANPGAPHYLTPVYFNREVLRKYYQRPELYTVEDGYLRCAGLWGLRVDNDHPDHVMVFLGDLGRDLPSPSERDYWRSFNILPPDPRMSETAFRRAFLGQFADAQAPDLTFRHHYESFASKWRTRFGWDLYRLPEAGDEHVLNGIRIPLTNSDPDFEEQMLNLARLLCDFLNDAALREQLGEVPKDTRSIGKLEMWLQGSGYPHTGRDIALLKAIQSLRSKGSTHRKGSDYARLIASQGRTHQETVAQFLTAAAKMLDDFGEFFALDESAP
jgi:hypothetical protein